MLPVWQVVLRSRSSVRYSCCRDRMGPTGEPQRSNSCMIMPITLGERGSCKVAIVRCISTRHVKVGYLHAGLLRHVCVRVRGGCFWDDSRWPDGFLMQLILGSCCDKVWVLVVTSFPVCVLMLKTVSSTSCHSTSASPKQLSLVCYTQYTPRVVLHSRALVSVVCISVTPVAGSRELPPTT